jgi:hypothetical protein
MTPHPTHKLALIASNRIARAEEVGRALQVAGENIYSLARIVTKTLPSVEREADEFHDFLGEPLPAHLKDALDRELWSWRALQESLALYEQSEPTAADAARYVTSVRRFLGYQHDLICLEATMLQTCLIEPYRKRLTELAILMREVPL